MQTHEVRAQYELEKLFRQMYEPDKVATDREYWAFIESLARNAKEFE